MNKILYCYDMSSQFLDYLHGFGFKVRGEDENFNGFYRVKCFSNVQGKNKGSQRVYH